MAPHGIHGEVEVEIHTDFPQRFVPGARFLAGEHKTPLTVERVRPHKKRLLITFEEISDRTAAEHWRGAWLQVPIEDAWPLEPGEYYEFQLMGLEVWTEDAEYLGVIEHIIHTGANDVYVVQGARGEVLIPAITEVILEVDIEAGRMTVHVLPGLLD